VPGSEEDPENTSPWFVFNDFAVRNVSEEEALNFPDLWKASPYVICEVNWFHVDNTGSRCPLPGESGHEREDQFRCAARRDRYFSAQPRQ